MSAKVRSPSSSDDIAITCTWLDIRQYRQIFARALGDFAKEMQCLASHRLWVWHRVDELSARIRDPAARGNLCSDDGQRYGMAAAVLKRNDLTIGRNSVFKELMHRRTKHLLFAALIVAPPVAAQEADEAPQPPPPARWLGSEDYPVAAIRAGAEGSVRVEWKITVLGFATDCKVVQSSGNADLDAASCDTIMRRARYTPAIDQYGMPIESRSSRTIKWVLPK